MLVRNIGVLSFLLLLLGTAICQPVPSWSIELRRDSVAWATRSAESAIFTDAPDDMDFGQMEHLYGIGTGLGPIVEAIFIDWKPGIKKPKDDLYRIFQSHATNVCNERLRHEFRKKNSPGKCIAQLMLVADKVYAGNFGEDLRDETTSVKNYPPPTPIAQPATARNESPVQRPIAQPNSSPTSPVQQQSMSGKPAEGCVKALQNNGRVIILRNDCQFPVVVELVRTCRTLNAFGERRANTTVPSGLTSHIELESKFGSYCGSIADTRLDGLGSQRYQ